MPETLPRRGSRVLRDTYGSSSAEAFMIIAIATILITRGYLHLTGYPQVGGKTLHIAHALYGGALMMLALLIGWTFVGFASRVWCVVLGGIGFGLFLDEVGKFVTKDNDYFYGPSAEMMYVLVVLLLVLQRIVRDIRPPTAAECLANSAAIAAEGVAHGLPEHRKEWAVVLLQSAATRGADPVAVEHIQGLLDHAAPTPARLKKMQDFAPRLIPNFFRSPRWIPIVGWAMVFFAFFGLVFGAVGVALGGWFYEDEHVTLELAGVSVATVLLLISAGLTFLLAFPAMIALRRTDNLWPLKWLRNAALIFTMLNALVDFATEGFAALFNLGVGLFTLAILTYQVNARGAQKVADRVAAMA
ncbi:hypothetical protein [Antrihabitans sp. YC2-6]|uniref:hypothetical protein n=1 Tax=Antrihabitans sp. YC2-6 TaxID=2799498 RepID=UPI0018F2E0C9|nr:hypothetical protein [Antrihabitans sp. YC2-6]MBJ8343485.1 hypothetical protein [Antrihabitans sp. YC2-6]